MNEILLNVLSVLLTAVILPLISIAGTQLIKFINSKIKNNELAKQLTTATSIVTNAVRKIVLKLHSIVSMSRSMTLNTNASTAVLVIC